MRSKFLTAFVLIIAYVMLAAFACKTPNGQPQTKEIQLAKLGLEINFSLNQGVKGLRSLHDEKLIKDAFYVKAIETAQKSQAVADKLNRNLDKYASIDSSNKSELIAFLIGAAGDFVAISNELNVSEITNEERKPLQGILNGIIASVRIAANVVSLVDKPTPKESIKFSATGLNFASQ